MTDPYVEKMRDGFVKFHLGDGRVLHWITSPDGEEYHSHPFAIDVQVLKGWYRDEIMRETSGTVAWNRSTKRPFSIPAARRHRITDLSPGGCLTLCTYGPHERETRFYRQTENGVQSRAWNGSYDDEGYRRARAQSTGTPEEDNPA